jgi:hypothetical protein
MSQRSTSPRTLQATSPDVPLALFGAIAALLLVLVLITVQTGAGIGFA